MNSGNQARKIQSCRGYVALAVINIKHLNARTFLYLNFPERDRFTFFGIVVCGDPVVVSLAFWCHSAIRESAHTHTTRFKLQVFPLEDRKIFFSSYTLPTFVSNKKLLVLLYKQKLPQI